MDIYVIDNEYYLYMGNMIAKGNGKKLPDDPIEIFTLDDAMKKTGVFEIAYLEKTVTGCKTGEPSLCLKVERKDISGWKISEN